MLAARGTTAVALGTLVLLAGGGYALASGGSSTIHACVRHKGGDIYIAKKCAKHDKKISWNKTGPTGPQGPQGSGGAAGYLLYNATGTAAGTTTTLGTLGPFTFSASCTASGGVTRETITLTGPSAQVDGMEVLGGEVQATSNTIPASTNAVWDSDGNASSTPTTWSSHYLIIPSSGTALDYLETFSVAGSTTNTCHFSATATPTSAGGVPSAVPGAVTRRSVTPFVRHGSAIVAERSIR